MLFPTLNFLLFFLTVAAAMVPLRQHHEARKIVLLVASYYFYAQWNWHFCALLAASSCISFVAGRAIAASTDERYRRAVVATAVTMHLLLLGTFKYCDFLVGSANALARALGLTHELPFIEIILPVGISFFTFHGISYVVDVYRRDVAVCRRLTDMLLYMAFFPQLVAGPIVRASFLLPQLYAAPRMNIAIGPPLMLILGGLFKKVVMANYLATDLVDPVFFDPASFATADLLLAAYGYAVQIYCDFSAYSDMAIGLAALLGYRFPPNFNQPYRAQNFQDFWRRWHISLSSWLRDYLYKPLGGSRHGSLLTMRNLLITMLLGGIWHGAAWKFVAWGAMHGAALVAERALFGSRVPKPRTMSGRILSTLFVFHIVCLAWVFFRADSFDTVLIYLGAMAKFTPGITQATPFTVTLIALGLATQFVPADSSRRIARGLAAWPSWALAAGAGLGAICIDALGPDGVAPFIYFQF
jgi:D-alanyl-lipoteichoic acid acyltransferase DltB (MBOAT superfamily)